MRSSSPLSRHHHGWTRLLILGPTGHTKQRCFRFDGQQFYKGKKKQVPRMIDRWLTPRGLAYWYMDDGAQKWRGRSLGVRLCTDGFTHDEVRRLAAVLTAKFNLNTSLQKKGGSFRIYISSYSYDILRATIYHHLLTSMLYKFPDRREKHGSN